MSFWFRVTIGGGQVQHLLPLGLVGQSVGSDALALGGLAASPAPGPVAHPVEDPTTTLT
jgi:hypothetical protein